jgi:hypothetical protein
MPQPLKPQRQWTLHLTIAADTAEEAGAILRFIAYEWESGSKRADFAGEGPLGDFEVEVMHRPEMTSERFRRNRAAGSDSPASSDAGSPAISPVRSGRTPVVRPKDTGPAGSFGLPAG